MLFAVVEQGAAGSNPPADALGPASLDREAMMERPGGDADLSADVVDLFLEDCLPHVAAIEAAVGARDADRLRAAAHVLKGVAANLSAAVLFEAAQTLERLGAESRLEPPKRHGADCPEKRPTSSAQAYGLLEQPRPPGPLWALEHAIAWRARQGPQAARLFNCVHFRYVHRYIVYRLGLGP